MIDVQFNITVAPIISLILEVIWHGCYTCLLAIMIHSAFCDAKKRKWRGLVFSLIMAILFWLIQFFNTWEIFQWLEIVAGG